METLVVSLKGSLATGGPNTVMVKVSILCTIMFFHMSPSARKNQGPSLEQFQPKVRVGAPNSFT